MPLLPSNPIHSKPVTPCWIWLGQKRSGYGRIQRGRINYTVHKYVWEQLNGPLSKDMELHHLCGVRHCYNPEHLMCLGRTAHMYIDRRIRDTCPKGHALSGENLYVHSTGSRGCKICRVESVYRSRDRRKNASD